MSADKQIYQIVRAEIRRSILAKKSLSVWDCLDLMSPLAHTSLLLGIVSVLGISLGLLCAWLKG